MLIPKADIFERVEQTVGLFRKNIIQLSVPLFILFAVFAIWKELFTVFVISDIDISLDGLNDPSMIFLQNEFIMAVVISLLALLVYGILYIFFYIATFKWIIQAYRGENVSISDNIMYWSKSLWNASKTYYYKFLYVYLIPALVFIVWSIFFLWSLTSWGEDFIFIGTGTVVVLILTLLIFSIYRWIKATFAICSAIDKESYTRENFKQSIVYTHNNWWRILGNILLISFAVWFISSLVLGLVSALIPTWIGASIAWDLDVEKLKWGLTPENIAIATELVNNYMASLSILNIWAIISWVIWSFINAIFTAFTMTFVYILFKRLELEHSESEWVEIKNISAMKHEERDESKKNISQRGVIEEL